MTDDGEFLEWQAEGAATKGARADSGGGEVTTMAAHRAVPATPL